MESVLILLAIVLAVYLGNKFEVNTGILALGFAYLIGAFVVGMTIDEILGTSPIRLFMASLYSLTLRWLMERSIN